MLQDCDVISTRSGSGRRCRESNSSNQSSTHPTKRRAEGSCEPSEASNSHMKPSKSFGKQESSENSSFEHGESRDSFDGPSLCAPNSSVLSFTSVDTAVPMSKLRRMKEGNALPPAFDLQAVVSTTDLDMADSCICSAATCHPISKITEHIYVGSWKDSQDPDILAKYGITYVLNIAAEHDPEDILETVPGVNNKWIPLKDAQSQNITQVLDDAFNFLETARLKHAKALVHCRRGISRSPAIVIAYLMATEGRSFPNALDYVSMRRPCVSLNLGFRDTLSEYSPDNRWRHDTHTEAAAAESEEEEEPCSPMHLNRGKTANAFGDDSDSD